MGWVLKTVFWECSTNIRPVLISNLLLYVLYSILFKKLPNLKMCCTCLCNLIQNKVNTVLSTKTMLRTKYSDKTNLVAGLTGVVLCSLLSSRFSDVINTGVWVVILSADPHLKPSLQSEIWSLSLQILTVLSSEQDTIWPRSLELLATLVTSPGVIGHC